MKKTLATLALAACAFLPGCYGPNNAWNNLHDWNGKVTESKWGNEAVFLAFIPVYGLCYPVSYTHLTLPTTPYV